VYTEIVANQEQWGARAGIPDSDVEFLQLTQQRIAIVDRHLPSMRKALEILEDTRAHLDDQRQRRVFMIAKSVEARGELAENADLLAKYATTREYRSAVGYKAARTRRRNQQNAEQAEQTETDTTSTDE
jgi:hypothetical protein